MGGDPVGRDSNPHGYTGRSPCRSPSGFVGRDPRELAAFTNFATPGLKLSELRFNRNRNAPERGIEFHELVTWTKCSA